MDGKDALPDVNYKLWLTGLSLIILGKQTMQSAIKKHPLQWIIPLTPNSVEHQARVFFIHIYIYVTANIDFQLV